MPDTTIFDDVASQDGGTTIFDQVASASKSDSDAAINDAEKIGFPALNTKQTADQEQMRRVHALNPRPSQVLQFSADPLNPLPAVNKTGTGHLDIGEPPEHTEPAAPLPPHVFPSASRLVSEQIERRQAQRPVAPPSGPPSAAAPSADFLLNRPVELSDASQPEAPQSDADIMAGRKTTLTFNPVTGTPIFLPTDDSPEAKEEADTFNQSVREGIMNGTGVAGLPKISRGMSRYLGESVYSDVPASERLSGLAEASGGALEASTPLLSAGAGEALTSLPKAFRFARDMAAIYGTQKAVEMASRKYGLSPQATQVLSNTVALAAPVVAARTLGKGDVSVEQPTTGFKAEQTTVGPIAVAQAESPTGTRVGVKVGPFRYEHVSGPPQPKPVAALDDPTLMNYGPTPSGGRPMPPSPPGVAVPQPSPAAPDMASDAASALATAAQREQMAARVAAGQPPVPPVPPTPPPPVKSVSPQDVAQIGDRIAALPPDQRAQAMGQAHDQLAKTLFSEGRVVGPDGKLEIIDTPKKAAVIAQKWINDEVDRRDEAAAEQAKASASTRKPGSEGAAAASGSTPAPSRAESVSAVRAAGRQTFDVVGEEEPGVESANAAANQSDRSGPAEGSGGRLVHLEEGTGTPGESGPARPQESASSIHEVIREEEPEQPTKKLGVGDRVALPDGRTGKIVWTHPSMNIVRVRTEMSGTTVPANVSIGASQLKPAPERAPVASAPRSTAEKPKYDYASTQVNLPKEQADKVTGAAKKLIAPEDLSGKGLETQPHVTVKYGVEEDAALLRSALSQHEPFDATLGKLAVFPPSKNSDGNAVVVAEVKSPEFGDLHKSVHEQIGAKDDDFEYKPHVTLGYVKPEAAAKYEGSDALEGTKFAVRSVALSKKNGTQVEIPLGSMRSRPAPNAKPVKREDVAGKVGSETTLITPSSKIGAHYKLVEASDLVPSHDAMTFSPNAKYPSGVQERAYHTSKEAQARVIQQAQQYDPSYTVNTNPDAVNGPPVVTPDGTVLGGNSRTMSTQRLYGEGNGQTYKEYLRDRADTFGYSPEDVDAMKEPMLVRQVPQPESIDEMRRLGSDLNKSATGALSVEERAVSAGKSIKPDTLDVISRMRENIGEDATLRQVMNEYGSQLVKAMVDDGVITDRERPQFVDSSTGGLTEEGKNFIERALLGTVVDDPTLLERVPRVVLGKLEGSLGELAGLGARDDDFNILPILREALAEHAEVAQRGLNVEDYLSQSSMFGGGRSSAVEAMTRFLTGKTSEVRKGIRQFAQDAKLTVPNQGMLAIIEPPSPARAFNEAFGGDLTDEQLVDAIRRAITEEKPGEVQSERQENRTAPPPAGIQPSGTGKAETGGEAGAREVGAGEKEPEEKPRLAKRLEERKAKAEAVAPAKKELPAGWRTESYRRFGQDRWRVSDEHGHMVTTAAKSEEAAIADALKKINTGEVESETTRAFEENRKAANSEAQADDGYKRGHPWADPESYPARVEDIGIGERKPYTLEDAWYESLSRYQPKNKEKLAEQLAHAKQALARDSKDYERDRDRAIADARNNPDKLTPARENLAGAYTNITAANARIEALEKAGGGQATLHPGYEHPGRTPYNFDNHSDAQLRDQSTHRRYEIEEAERRLKSPRDYHLTDEQAEKMRAELETNRDRRDAMEAELIRRGAVPERFLQVAKNMDELEEKYDALGSPNYVSGDLAKELLPEWADKKDRARIEEQIHPDASRAAYLIFQRKLARLKPGADVLLVTGPVGAGKTTFSSKASPNADLTYEVNLSSLAKAKEHIDNVLAHDAKPTVLYVHTTPELSAERRATRAVKENRPVSIDRSTEQHIELPRTLATLAKEYGDRINIDAVDNSKEGAPEIPVEKLGGLAYSKGKNELLRTQQAVLDRLHENGTISKELHGQLSTRTRFEGDHGLRTPGASGSSGKGEEGLARPESRVGDLIKRFDQALQDGNLPTDPRALRELARQTVGGIPSTYVDDIYDAIEGALNLRLREAVAKEQPASLLDRIQLAQRLEDQLGNRTRTLEASELQQFSTPLTLSQAAGYAADTGPAEKALEPTAGTGNLAEPLKDDGLQVDVTEMDPRRARVLEALGYPVRNEDYLRSKPTPGAYDVVVTNPPWGKASTGKYKRIIVPSPWGRFGDVAERFLVRSISDLAEGGRLVAIVPTTLMQPNSAGFRSWLNQKHTIRAIIQSPPGAYNKRGTSVDSLLMVVDKGKIADAPAPIMRVESKQPGTWEEYAEAVEPLAQGGTHARVSDRPKRNEADSLGEPQQTELGNRTPAARGDTGAGGGRGLPELRGLGTGAGASGPERAGVGTDLVPDESGPEPSDTGTEGGGVEPARAPRLVRQSTRALRPERVAPERLREFEEAERSPVFAPYVLRSTARGNPHPRQVVETRSLAGAPAPELSYNPSDNVWKAHKSGVLSDEQVDVVAAVGQAVENGHAYLAADDVGVGKSREIAASAMDWLDKGKAKRILVTSKSEVNLRDLEREFRIVAGVDPDRGHLPFKYVYLRDYKDASQRTGKARDYSPVPKTDNTIYVVESYNLTPYQKAIRDLDIDGLLADEAHTYKNEDAGLGQTWKALHQQWLPKRIPMAYFSATPATNLDELKYLYGLREWTPDGFEDWAAMKTGHENLLARRKALKKENEAEAQDDTAKVGQDSTESVKKPSKRKLSSDSFHIAVSPAEMEQIMRELKMKGKYGSRDLWRGGVEFNEQEMPLTQQESDEYRKAVGFLRDAEQAYYKYANENEAIQKGFGPASQLQFAAKRKMFDFRLKRAITTAKQALDAGEQPVISLINVHETKEGEGNVGAILRSINVQKILMDEETGDITDLGEIPEAIAAKNDLLERWADEFPASPDPIKAIQDALGKNRVSVITGDESADMRRKMMDDFQRGNKPVAIISGAGKTGVSLHHVVKTLMGAHGRRHLVLADYEWSATQFKQELGRVDRAGQISAPKISAITLGSAAEKKFISTIANRMKTLGAMSKGAAESTGTGALEHFELGGDIDNLVLRETWRRLPDDLKQQFRGRKFNDVMKDGSMRPRHTIEGAGVKDFLLQLQLMPVEEGNRIWDEFWRTRDEIYTGDKVAEAESRKTQKTTGEMLRQFELRPDLMMYEVRDAGGHKWAIISGTVTDHINELKPYLEGYQSSLGLTARREYTTFSSKTGDLVSGLRVRPSAIASIAKLFGQQATLKHTPEKALEDLEAGDHIELANGWKLRLGSGGEKKDKLIIDGAKLSNTDKGKSVMLHGARYNPVSGGFFFLPRTNEAVQKFLQRFPIKGELSAEAREAAGLPDDGQVSLDDLIKGESGELDFGKVGDAVKELIKQDVQPALEHAGIGLRETAALFVRAFYPRIEESNPVGRILKTAAPTDAVDALMRLQGERAQALYNFDAVTKGIEKMFDRLPEEARVDFVDRIQTGRKQPSDELQDIADGIAQIQAAQREQEELALNLERKPQYPFVLARKANYFHNRWEKKPGGDNDELDDSDESTRIERLYIPKRPLEGTKRFNLRQSYTLKEGIAAGGKPKTTNPIRMLRLRLEDGTKLVTARRTWFELRQLGMRLYVRKGQRAPDGFDRINDKIAKVYFPAALELGGEEPKIEPHEMGEWYVEANTARLLNNMLSVDRIRATALGRSIVWLKNASTAIELGLSPFHAVFETIEAASSQASVGITRVINQGLRQGDAGAFAQGMKDIITSPVAPLTMAREGAALRAYVEATARLRAIGLTKYGRTISGDQPHGVMEQIAQWRELRREKAIQSLLKQFPDLDQLVGDMWDGGLVMGQHRDYQVRAFGKTMREAFTEGNPLGAVLRGIPSVLQGTMKPLFEVYIPNLKYSLFLKMMSQAAAERSAELEAGTLTRPQLARQVADSVENRFGEMNFDSLFLNKTVKTSLQILFRSVTWKLGSVREFAGAGGGQSRELGKWAWDAYNLLGGGGSDKPPRAGAGGTTGEGGRDWRKAIPRIDPRASWVASLVLYSALIGSIASRLLSGKWPWEWTEEELEDKAHDTWDWFKQLYLETQHPRTGEKDSRGLPVRISSPTYAKEMEHALTHPGRYAVGSLSTLASKSLDIAENDDYFGNYVYNPNAGALTKLKQVAKYAAPEPFSISNFARGRDVGEGKTSLLGAFGFPRAPVDLDFTPAERMAHDLGHKERLTPEQVEEWKARREAVKEGTLSRKEMRHYIKEQRLTWLQRDFKGLTYPNALKVYDAASESEKDALAHLLRQKRRNQITRGRSAEVRAAEADEQ